jgi:hypothetical protein
MTWRDPIIPHSPIHDMPITLEGKKGMKMSQLTVKHCKMSAMLSTNSCETSYSQFMFTTGNSTENLTQTDDKRNGLTFDVCGSVHLGNIVLFKSNWMYNILFSSKVFSSACFGCYCSHMVQQNMAAEGTDTSIHQHTHLSLKLTVLKCQSVPTPVPAPWKTHQNHKKPMAVHYSCAPDDGCK